MQSKYKIDKNQLLNELLGGENAVPTTKKNAHSRIKNQKNILEGLDTTKLAKKKSQLFKGNQEDVDEFLDEKTLNQ